MIFAIQRQGASGSKDIAALHIRVHWTRQDRQRCYHSIDITLAGIGVSTIDSLSARVLRQLAYIHISDLQVQLVDYGLYVV
jgi:hypothetical protein